MSTKEPFNTCKILFIHSFVCLFIEGQGGRKRNINVWLLLVRSLLGTWPVTQVYALTGNRTSDPLLCRTALNPWSHTSQVWLKPSLLND